MSYYESIEEYTAEVILARNAYAADMEVQEGRCEKACGRKREKSNGSRRCDACRKSRRST